MPRQICVTTLVKLLTPVCLCCDRMSGKNVWQPTAGEWIKSRRQAVCTPGSAPGPTLGNEYERTLPVNPVILLRSCLLCWQRTDGWNWLLPCVDASSIDLCSYTDAKAMIWSTVSVWNELGHFNGSWCNSSVFCNSVHAHREIFLSKCFGNGYLRPSVQCFLHIFLLLLCFLAFYVFAWGAFLFLP